MTHGSTPDRSERPPRIGELLTRSGLLTAEQLAESLVIARASGKPLGNVLVENGLVSAHAMAMALADQHGGPLKTEFGFATGRVPVVQGAGAAEASPSGPPPLLSLAPKADDAAKPGAPAPVAPPPAATAALELQLEAETTARIAAESLTNDLLAQIDELEAARGELAAELANNNLAAARAHDRVTELERALRLARVAAAPPIDPQLDELKAVIELQEQALTAAAAREQELESNVAASSERAYDEDRHLLFAPAAGGYELLQRSGPAPAVGSLVQASGGRTYRVARHGPSPFPGGSEACAYLEA